MQVKVDPSKISCHQKEYNVHRSGSIPWFMFRLMDHATARRLGERRDPGVSRAAGAGGRGADVRLKVRAALLGATSARECLGQ
jgi:hypothetical protein